MKDKIAENSTGPHGVLISLVYFQSGAAPIAAVERLSPTWTKT